jgi:hypothetical protein
MPNLTTDEKRFLRQILIFYRHHHMSARNPQQREVDLILDKISKDIASMKDNDRGGS